MALRFRSGALNDPGFAGLSAEEIYARLLQNDGNASGGECQSPAQASPGGSARIHPHLYLLTMGVEYQINIPKQCRPQEQPVKVPRRIRCLAAIIRIRVRHQLAPADSGRCWTPAMILANRPQKRRLYASSTSGASPLSRPSGPPKRADMSLPSWTGHSGEP